MSINVEITCLCGGLRTSVALESDSLPVETALCHCNACRYTTGVLFLSCLLLSHQPGKVADLTTYQSSAKLTRHFCSTCGSHVFVHVFQPDQWFVCSGVVEGCHSPDGNSDQSLSDIVQHEFVADSEDGGLAPCLALAGGSAVQAFAQGPEAAPLHSRQLQLLLASGAMVRGEPEADPARSILPAGCHCKAVSYQITRPSTSSASPSAPWPDLLLPYHLESSTNARDVKWWLRSNGRYLAGTCACRSCRLGSGCPVQTWAFVPKVNITSTAGSSWDFRSGSLRQYMSSPGTYREFCATCGATVFWHCDERPDLIDVSVGLLQAPEGARAESWLDWCTDRVSFKEEARDTTLITNLEKALHLLKERESQHVDR